VEEKHEKLVQQNVEGLERLVRTKSKKNVQKRIKIKGIDLVEIPGKPYFMSKTEITVGQYRRCVKASVCTPIYGCDLGSSTWSHHPAYKENHPLTCVNWNQAKTFAKWIDGDLPNEDDWEYAARGGQGSQFKYAGSNQIDEVAWYGLNSGLSTHPVGQKKANGYGLYDMSGNVWEWTSSSSGPFLKILCGGGWFDPTFSVRMSYRHHFFPSVRNNTFGFRVIRLK
jgi:formylglycine-generating enzyme required for sulfatase activity